MSGKGSTPRPKSIPEGDYGQRWADTFPDSRETLRQANLDHARRVITGTPCADPAPPDDTPDTFNPS